MWEGRHREAAQLLNDLGNELVEIDRGLAAWNFHWSGASHLHAGDTSVSLSAFQQAANFKAMLGRPTSAGLAVASGTIPADVSAQAIQSVINAGGSFEATAKLALDRLQGDGGKNATEHEQAICDLGLLLGIESSRPGKKADRKGPDIAWICTVSNHAVGLEAKTQKDKPTVYKKRDIGQSLDSREWIKKNYPNLKDHIWMVGEFGKVVAEANPPSDLKVITLESMIDLAQRLVSAGRRISVRPAAASLQAATHEAFTYYGLLWPEVAESLECRMAVDLQDDTVLDDD